MTQQASIISTQADTRYAHHVSHSLGSIMLNEKYRIEFIFRAVKESLAYQCGAQYYANPNFNIVVSQEDATTLWNSSTNFVAGCGTWYDHPQWQGPNKPYAQVKRKYCPFAYLPKTWGHSTALIEFKRLGDFLYNKDSKDAAKFRKALYSRALAGMHEMAGANLVLFSDDHTHQHTLYKFWDMAEALGLDMISESHNHNSGHEIRFWRSVGTTDTYEEEHTIERLPLENLVF